MTPGKLYINKNPYSTYGIHLLRIMHYDAKQIKIKFYFIDKRTRSIIDLIPEKGRILVEDFKDWEDL